MKNRKLGGMLLTISLTANFYAPVTLAEERLPDELGINQLKLSDPLSEQLDSTDIDTPFNEGFEQLDDEIGEETSSEPELNSIPDSELGISR